MILHCMNDPQPEGHMASYIVRRKFLATLGGAAAAWPLAARAQQVPRLTTIGFLGSATPSAQSQWVAALVQRLREVGWIEGRNIAIEYRWERDAPSVSPRSRLSSSVSRSMSLSRRERSEARRVGKGRRGGCGR